ncbi:unnamed protein product [Mytilus coruscus]|uniref:Ig-like domain-containing protein n=1 Tax=Mytilus coruscus TaxID=42192 RepID=A0A6J8EVW7_MYTCO|nr:unnamed protein product [Mytilus coruscus]
MKYLEQINPILPHYNRLQVISSIQTGYYDLQISNVSVANEGIYYCTNDTLKPFSDYYKLKMINASRIRYKYYPEGSTVFLKCLLDMEWFGPAHFNSFYEPPVIVMHENRSMWTVNRYTEGKSVSRTLPHHNRLKVIRRIQRGDYGFQISKASLMDEGLYFCEDSEMPAAPDYYILQLISGTTVSSMHDMIEEINEGKTKKLCCYLDSNPTLSSLKWLRGNKTVLVSQNYNETCYTIKGVTRFDQGNYTCVAENVVGSGSVTVVLKVKYKPLVSSKHALNEEKNEGETTKLCCNVDSNPPPTSTRWLNGIKVMMVTHNINQTCYTIKSVRPYDQGNYTCTAENIMGSG